MKIFGTFLGTKLLALKIFGRSTECVGLKILGALFLGLTLIIVPAEGVVLRSAAHGYRLSHAAYVPRNIHSAPHL